MESEHIEARKLYDAVISEQTTLSEAECEHLKICDECLELIRIFVRQRIQAAKGSDQPQ